MDGLDRRSRSSTRHGPASVFSGPVRRWKKTWAPISTSDPSPVAASRVLLYKWVPLKPGATEEAIEEANRTHVNYVPVSVLLERKREAALRAEQEAKASGETTHDITTVEDDSTAQTSLKPMELAEPKGPDLSRAPESEATPVNQGDEGETAEVEDRPNEGEGPPIDMEKKDASEDIQTADAEMEG